MKPGLYFSPLLLKKPRTVANKNYPIRENSAPPNRHSRADTDELVQFFMIDTHRLGELNRLTGHSHKCLAASDVMKPLSLTQTSEFVKQGLQAEGWKNCPAFDSQVFDIIHLYSRGVPQTVCKICNQLLLRCYVEQNPRVSIHDAKEIARELSQVGLVGNEYSDSSSIAADSLSTDRGQETPLKVDPAAEQQSAATSPGTSSAEPGDLPNEPGAKAVFTSRAPTRKTIAARRGRW